MAEIVWYPGHMAKAKRLIKEALPNIKIAILEPFGLKGGATEGAWEYFSTEVPKRAAMAKKIAEKFNLPFIPLQDGFDKLCESAPASYWLGDGVHPTQAGHTLIKRAWLCCYDENWKDILVCAEE